LKSILGGAWSPSLGSIESVFYVITNEPITFLSLTENGQALIFVGLTTSGGPTALTKNN
jgi:hypothetical protein